MKKKLLIPSILFVVVMVFFLGSSACKTKTAASVRVIEVSQDYIVVEDELKGKTTINVPQIITKLVEVNKEYFVEYEYSKIQSPKLVSIDPLK